MLDYLGGPIIIKKILMSETGRQANQSRNDTTLKKKKKGKEKDLPQNLHQGKQPFSDTLTLTH